MQEKRELVVDTCVFFRMIRYNDFCKNNGVEATRTLIERDYAQAEELKREILYKIPPNFLKENSNLNIDQILLKYKDYATNRMNQIVKRIKENIKSINGWFKDKKEHSHSKEENQQIKKGYEDIKQMFSWLDCEDFQEMFAELDEFYSNAENLDYHPKSQQMLDKLKAEIIELQQEYKLIFSEYRRFLEARNDYKTALDMCDAGVLYLKALSGEYSLNIVPVSFDEIMNHVAENHPEGTSEGFLTFSLDQVESLAKHCNLIMIKDEELLQLIDLVALQLRTPIDDKDTTKPMDQDINSLGRYGDSTIAATALVLGYILVTQNIKDFIEDRSKKSPNDNIREHVLRVAKKYNRLVSDALPHSVSEIISGEIIEPTRGSSKQIQIVSQNEMFASEMEVSF